MKRFIATAGRRAAALTLILSSAFPALALADGRHEERGGHDYRFRDHEFREREFRDRAYFDSRFHHDRYYAPRGYVFGALPLGVEIVLHRGVRFYFGSGLWYRSMVPGRFEVVAPPLGVTVSTLPPFYSTLWVGPTPYYYANQTYYLRGPGGYTVVEAPPADAVIAQPPPAVAQASAERVFVYPRNGQSEQQTNADRDACGDWATGQTGYDPRFATSVSDSIAVQKRGDYQRALGACLDGRGYTVK